MLRLALIENLRRVAARIAASTAERNLADTWAERMIEIAGRDAKSLILATADMARSNPPMTSSFVAELARRLQGQGAALALPLTWIEQRLAELDLTIEQLVQAQTQEQAADQVSMANSIGSLRLLGAIDWREFVEALSVVEQALREDRGLRRDGFRHPRPLPPRGREDGEGKPALRRRGGARGDPPGNGGRRARRRLPDRRGPAGSSSAWRGCGSRCSTRCAGRGRRHGVALYLGAIALGTGILTACLLDGRVRRRRKGLDAGARRPGRGACHQPARGGAGQPPRHARWRRPKPLPRMDFSARHPAAVAHPGRGAGDAGRRGADRAAGRGAGSALPRQPRRQPALTRCSPISRTRTRKRCRRTRRWRSAARDGIDALNRKYRSAERFFLFHRPRRWNPGERRWMGYERKRGKLVAAQCLPARRPRRIASRSWSGETAVLRDGEVRDHARHRHAAAARRGAPAGRAPWRTRSTVQYGILQPRMAVSLPATSQSRYAQLFGAEPGIDPYTRAVSDVYQDLFGEGSFIGKGIYDVDAFERALDGALPREPHPQPRPARRLLCALRAAERRGAVRGVSVALQRGREPPPPLDPRRLADRALAAAARAGGRRQAGTRIRCRGCRSGRSSTTCGAASRRSRWWRCCSRAGRLAVLAIVLVPALLASLLEVLRKPADVPLRRHLAAAMRSSARHLAQAAFTLACLPYEAFFSLDAIAAHARPDAGHPHAAAGMDALRRGGRPMASPPFDRCGSGRSLAIAAALWLSASSPAALRARGAGSPPVARLARHRLVDQPSARAPRSAADARSRSLSCARPRARPGRSSRPSSARRITGCRRTTTRSTRWRSSRTAPRRPTWGSRCWRTCRRTTSAISAPASSSSAPPMRSARCRPWSATAATSTTGTTRARSSRCRRSTSRRWTAATSPAIC